MTIAVTGATGQLGSLVIDSLLASQEASSLVAIVRDADKAASIAERGVEVRVATYDDPESLETAVAGVDTLLLISSSEVGKRVKQHSNVIDAARDAGVQRIVYTSAPHATTSELVLAPEHKGTEEYLTASGLTYTILRNNWYNENYLAQLDAVRESGILLAAAGNGKVASASRKDFADGTAVVLTQDGHDNAVYEFAGDVAWTYDELAAAFSEAVGREVVYKPVEPAELIQTLTENGVPEGSAKFVAALDANIAAGVLDDADPVLAQLIGRRTTPVAETLRG